MSQEREDVELDFDELPLDEQLWYQNEYCAGLVECVSHYARGCSPLRGFSQELWLFCVACSRLTLIGDERFVNGCALLEAFGSGRDKWADDDDWRLNELRAGYMAAKEAATELDLPPDHPMSALTEALRLAIQAMDNCDEEIAYKAAELFMLDVNQDILPSKAQCELVREIFGDSPYPILMNDTWLSWNDFELMALAEEMNKEGRFDRFSFFCERLEEAGCTDSRILAHCRKEFHVRGCWLLSMFTNDSGVLIEGQWLNQIPSGLHQDDDGTHYARTVSRNSEVQSTRVSFSGNGLRCFVSSEHRDSPRILAALEQHMHQKKSLEICISGKVLNDAICIIDVRKPGQN